MDDSPQDVYAKYLPNNRGYPLWFPEPSSTLPSSYRQDGLQIGDVGYVSQKGRFNVLFNICHGPNHALHRRPGVSPSFDPIALDVDHEVDVISNADPPGCVITSPGVMQQTSQRPGHYEFSPSSAKGAILILPDGATSHDLPGNERFRKLAMERAFDWYEIAKAYHGESISSGSLYLITGFYKARSWSLASFHDTTVTEHRHIRVVPRECEATTGREWKCTFPVQYRDGPGPGHNGNVNQTVFISGFKIAVREDVLRWWTQEPIVEFVPAVRRRKDPCHFARFLMHLFGKKKISKRRRRANGDADINHVPALSQPFHPSDIINRYLLNKDPEALVAVTHDSEWINLIETGKLTPEELVQEDRLGEFLSENYSLVSQPELSAVYLQGKSKDVSNQCQSVFMAILCAEAGLQQGLSSESEGFWYAKPSTDNLQVVITRIRAEDVAAGFSRMPVGFYVLVQFDGTKRRTENKPVRLHDSIVEWDDRIQLPSEPSAKVQLSVCASFEFSPLLGNGELLRTADICVGDLPDNTRLITFPPTEGKPVLPCFSLLITIERQRFRRSEAVSDHGDDLNWEESSDLAQLTDQGHEALLRYRVDPRKANVATSVEHFEHALRTCPPGHQSYAAVLCNQAMAYFVNCQIDRLEDISTSISFYREALKLRRVGHPDRPATLLRLAQVLTYHYGKHGFERSVPGEITELVSEVQAICSVDSHERRAADLALQTYTLYKAISCGSLTDIDKLIPALRQAVQDIPHDYFDKLQRLTNLGLALRIRYEFRGNLDDLDESIAIYEEAMQFTSCGHPYEPVMLTSLGVLFLSRFGRSGELEDLNKSIRLTEDAIRCTPEHHFDYPSRITSLSSALIARFKLLDEMGDFARSTSLLKKAAWLTQPHHPERPAVLFIFGVSRFADFHLLGDHGYLDSTIALIEEALRLTPNSHFARPRMLTMLSSSYFTRFEISRDPVDLDDSISRIQEAVGLTQTGHFNRPEMVDALHTLLFLRFQAFGRSADLDRSICLLEEVIQTTPDHDPSQPTLLARLGTLLFTRFEQLDDLPDLDSAISALERAVERALEGQLDRLEMLITLGSLFRARFRRAGEVGDLDRSIRVIEDALGLTPVGHAVRPRVLTSLGTSWVMRTQHLRRQGDTQTRARTFE